MRVRATLAVGFAMLLAPLLLSGAAPVAAFPLVNNDADLQGIARDAVGRVLSGVEILVLADGRSGAIVTSAVTDDRGRFRIPSIPPGLYRVAAIKQGYLAQVTRVNTYLRTSFDLVLRPVPRPGEPGGELVTPSSSWMLRLPPRSVLRETDPSDLLASTVPSRLPVAPAPAFDASAPTASAVPDVRGQVQHLVALGRESGGGSASSSGVVGGETSIRLTGAIGQRGSVSFSGRRDSIESSDRPLESPGRRRETGLAFDLSYDTGNDGSIDVTAFYAQGDVRYSAPVEIVDPVGEGHRSWGYDATYRRQLDAVTRVAVQFGYADASLRLPEPFLDPAIGPGHANVTNRSVGAEGTYETVAGDRHQIRVGMRARRLDLAVPWVRSAAGTTFLGVPGAAGLSVRVDAEDQWAVTGPITVAYGFSLVQALEGREASLVVPRAGIAWNGARTAVRLSASHYTLMTWQTGAGGESLEVVEPVDALHPERPWGYEAEVEVPLPATLRVRGRVEYTPVQDATALSGDALLDARPPMFVSGARAADRRTSVTLTRPSRRSDVFLEVVEGEVRGLLAPSAALDLPVQILDEREIDYRSARAGVRAAASGTDVSVEYRSSSELPRAPLAHEAPFVSEYWELVFGQSLLRSSRIGASCRVLISARWAPEVRGGADSLDVERARRIAAFNHRWAAGVLVSF